ncbi:coiled-coil domain-containing protein [Salinibacillus xinjiangensis]|uniref:YhgE/Pip domain-containing protein n=1 Tax=Salinibacillus xinjiangensis TaxID=1229268 RepID=A0A6G1X823_9BACI|nr:YhgE/Pip domain-containing protein [Salinibacillus xinjiangensis]MRG87153.1 YhgE/Pip domain-containing protein [Salinibacillus xinjiangensis]
MRIKRITAIILAFLLVIPTFTQAQADESSSEKTDPQGEGSYSEKNEVVYATLNASGDQEEMYIVNNFTIDQPGKMIDYGPYTSVENLTNLNDIQFEDNEVKFSASEDQYYYQGNLEGKALPWDIQISYKLNGETVKPEELLGKDGQFEIQIDTKANDKANSVFFDNYLLQVSLPLNSEIYQNIEAENGTIASAGKNKQVTFTVMPGKEETFNVKADVTDLEMESIEIAAMPSSMSIDTPDAGEMKNDMKSLSDATAEINDGVGELKDGVTELNDGVAGLHEGSKEYKSGIHELDNGSSDLVEGSKSIDESLEQISQSLEKNSGETNLSELKELQAGLSQMAEGLKEVEGGLSELIEGYNGAYQALDQSIEAIPGPIPEEDLEKLYNSNADPKVIEQLIKNYEAAQTTKQTYTFKDGNKPSVQEFLQSVGPTLEGVVESLKTMRTQLETMADGLDKSLANMDVNESMKQLQKGLKTLSTKYKDFHSGLVKYTNGVGELSSGYDELHDGVTELTEGTDELENGVDELHDGTTELANSTNDLPDQMQDEIDEVMNEFDKSDFEPVSFVSSKNTKVNSVQFVIKTESIKKDEEEKEVQQQEKEEEKGFWDRLLDLFR